MVENDEKSIELPMIIAMKGHPGTGKSTLARSLAVSLRLPLIDKDDIRDSTFSVEQALLSSSVPHADASRLLNNLSYDAMWRITATQVRHGPGAIIDSPLSRRAHLDRLVEIASLYKAKLFVIECSPREEVMWRHRLEERGRAVGASWHKPSTWHDMERLLEEYGGCTEYDVGDVSRLVVDTTQRGCGTEEMVSMVVDFILDCNRL